MASKPFMKLYISDYLTDTYDLTTLEHGAYLLLIMHYFQTGKSLPDNKTKLARICKLSVQKFSKVESALKDFFFICDGQWFHKRIEKELDEMSKKSDTARVSAMHRWSNDGSNSNKKDDANAMRTQCERNANAMLTDTDTDTDTESDKETERTLMSGKPDVASHKSQNLELKKQAIAILDFLNRKTGKKFRPVDTNLKMIIARLKSGVSFDDCRSVVAKKINDWKTQVKMESYLRPKTLFSATNFEQYLGELIQIEEKTNEL
jgi:uncharacterized phage protein (TIGR02220 family)